MSELSTEVAAASTEVTRRPGGLTAHEEVESLIMGRKTIFSTIVAETLTQKLEILTAITEAEPLSEHLDQPIALKHLVAQVVEVGQDDGTMEEAIRTIIIAEDGTAYTSVSRGLFKSIQNVLEVLGDPSTWGSAAIPIRVVKRTSRREGREFFTVKMA